MPSPRFNRRADSLPAFWRLGEGVAPDGAFVALVPGAEAPLLALTLPQALNGPAREAVARRQVLDRLGPGHTLRVPSRPGWTRALVVLEGAPARWRAVLGAASGRCRGVLPDYLALPVVPEGWSLASDAAGLRVRLGPDDGFSAERELGLEMLARALDQARTEGRAPRAVLRLGPPDSGVEALLAGLPAAPSGAILAHDEGALDLLRDPVAQVGGFEARLRAGLVPAALVVIAALGWTAANGLALVHDRNRAAALSETTLAAVRRDLIPDAPIVDLQVQVLRAIEARRQPQPEARPEPLALLRRAAGVLARVEVESLDLSADGLRAMVRLDGFAAMDVLMADLVAQGLMVQAQSPDIGAGGGVSATLVLAEGAP